MWCMVFFFYLVEKGTRYEQKKIKTKKAENRSRKKNFLNGFSTFVIACY